MEAVLLHPTSDHHHHQSISPNKHLHIQNPRNFISRSSEIFSPYSINLVPNIYGGIGFHSVPQLSSFPISNRKPPLLPLPVTKKPYSSLPNIPPTRNNNNNNNNKPNFPCSPVNRKNINNRSSSIRDQDHLLKSKKSKSSSISPPKKQINNNSKQKSRSIDTNIIKEGDALFITSTKRLGPEPSDIPKQVSRVLKKPLPSSTIAIPLQKIEVTEEEEEFSGSIFSLAPPPSSLPLPKFSMRPKLSCNVEAGGGIDDGATDNLRRLLRIR